VTDGSLLEGDPDGCDISYKVGSEVTSWGIGTCDLTAILTPGTEQPATLIRATNCRRDDRCTFGFGSTFQLVDNASTQRCVGGTCYLDDGFDGFDIVVTASPDEYTMGVSEMPFYWGSSAPEALKVQAVASRSYASSIAATTDHRTKGCFCDVRNDSSYQVYAGWLLPGSYTNNWIQAATDTSSMVVAHPAAPDGPGIVRAYFSSSNGGRSEWVKEKWGSDYSYLTSVADPWSIAPEVNNPYASWTQTVGGDTVAAKVWGSGTTLTLIDARVTQRNVSGSAKTVRFTGRQLDGSEVTKDVASGTVTSWFGLNSWYFDIDDSALITHFSDISESIFQGDIDYLASIGAAVACDDGPDRFCPDDRMRREDLAAFMVRALHLPASSKDWFNDDDGLPFEAEINALAQAGITRGCNPPANDRFCPDNTVSRGQTAAFIVRAWSLSDPGPGDWFVDDDANEFHGDIDRLAQTGITKGCNPPTNDKYCPTRLLTRGEMSAFLARALRSLGTP
jgi:SpoIID/LytB domain protein